MPFNSTLASSIGTDLSVYQNFVSNEKLSEDAVVLRINETAATPLISTSAETKSQKFYRACYRFLFGQKKSTIVESFRVALETKYGSEIASFAFSKDQQQQALDSGLSKGIITEVIKNAAFAKEAKSELEMYADAAGINITMAYETFPNRNFIQEEKTLHEKFSKVQQFASCSLDKFENIEALQKALADAITVATTSKEVIAEVTKAKKKIEELITKLESLKNEIQASRKKVETATANISSIQKEVANRLTEIENQQNPTLSPVRFINSVNLADRALARYKLQQKQEPIVEYKRTQLEYHTALAMAPEQTAITEANSTEYVYKVTQAALELLNTDKKISNIAENMVASADRKVALVHTILASAKKAEKSAQKIAKANSVEAFKIASQIFYVAAEAKLMALSPNNDEILNLKKELKKIQDSLDSLATPSSAIVRSLSSLPKELRQNHVTFLLAETRSPEEAADAAEKIAITFSEHFTNMQESADQTTLDIQQNSKDSMNQKASGILASLEDQQKKIATLLQQAANHYAILSFCKKSESHQTLFHEGLTTLQAALSSDDDSDLKEALQQALNDFTEIETLISTKEEAPFTILNIDSLQDQEENANNIIGFNGKITVPPSNYTPTTEDYEDGVNLVRLSIAQKLGIDAVARFDTRFQSKMHAKLPLKVQELSSFIKKEKEKLTGSSNYFFITKASSLEALREQLKSVDDQSIIRSDPRVDDFNPFETPKEQTIASLNLTHTMAENYQDGIEKALQVVLGTIESKEENNIEYQTVKNLFNENIKTTEKKRNRTPMTVGELKAFLDKAILLRSSSYYMARHLQHYMHSAKAAQSFSNAMTEHVIGPVIGHSILGTLNMLSMPEPTFLVLSILTSIAASHGLNRLNAYLANPTPTNH